MPYRYEEKVLFSPLIAILYVVLLVVFFVSVVQRWETSLAVVPLLLVALLLLAIPLNFGRLVIAVDEKSLTASWGYLGWPKKIIPLEAIERSEVISYRPIRQFGGWGIRSGTVEGEKTACYTMRGDRGVLLSLSTEARICLTSTRKFLIGSQEPERLQAALGK